MDGTTLNSQHALTPRTVEAIRRADALGLQVIIATGRPVASLQPFIDQLSLKSPVPAVCFNGACAMMLRANTPEENRVLLSRGLDREAARLVLQLCEERDWCVSHSSPGGAAAAPRSPQQEEQLRAFEALEGIKQERVASLDLLDLPPPLKLVVLAEDPEACAALARASLPDGVANIIAAEMHIEFLSRSVSKGDTLQRLCADHLGISIAEVIAFGDNHNDREMLQLVGHGVAMHNAKDAVKAIAARVCKWSNDDEGIARELEALMATMEVE
ncbi:unnamed protein product [Polarella glacialis]|uniref:Uncharacterized protein n=1 Tax=Polarella glacialis TaxID=89957 RepID=A0A813KWJ6_POLGL|nr:unnamed protein product [Polarella glacialis]